MLEFFERGDGPATTLLLHGFLGSGRNLSSLARAWSAAAPRLRLVVPDLPGHGSSPTLSADPSLEELAQGVLELAHHTTQDPVRILGHSLGGRVAIEAAVMAPQKIAAVTLLDIAPGPVLGETGPARVIEALVAAPDSAGSRREMAQHLGDVGAPPKLIDWLLMNLTRGPDGYQWRINRPSLAKLHAATRHVDLWPRLESSPKPHVDRCIRGGESDYVTDEDVARFASHGVAVHTIEGAGHFLHAEALDALVAVLCDA